MTEPRRAAVGRLLAASAVASLVAAGFALPSYPLLIATEILILGTFALGFNLLFGYAGLLSFGQAAFFGAGAYAAAFLLLHGVQSIWLVLLLGPLAAALLAVPLGFLAVRRDEIYFSILTLGLGMMFNAVAHNWREVTGGSDGLTGFGVPRLDLLLVEVPLARPRNMYLLCLAAAVLVVLLLRRIVASPFGLLLQATRENRERIAFVGGSLPRLRLAAFVLSAAVSGLAGVLFAIFNRIATPDMAHWSFSARPVLMTILGGAGTFLGPLVGAATFYGLEQAVTAYTQNWMIVLGAILIPIVILLPKGILGTATDLVLALRPEGSVSEPLLEVRKVSRHFGKFAALEDVSLSVERGVLCALIGPNGAGKTTFYNVVSGRIPPTKGAVLLDGGDVTGLPAHELVGRGLGRSFQITNVFPSLTVLENVMVPLLLERGHGWRFLGRLSAEREVRRRAEEVLDTVGLLGQAARVTATLAYGDKRLVEMAIVLARAPRLVLLDEPTAGMNPEETDRMIALIRELAARLGTTFFVTEHDMKVVFGLARRIFVLHQGMLLAQGSPDEIKANTFVHEAYLGTSP